jgi:hypothetical protein
VRSFQRPFAGERAVNVFLFGEPETTERDIEKAKALGFGWLKALFRWSDIEHSHKGAYDWTEADRVVSAVARVRRSARGKAYDFKLIARLDFQPWWARSDGARNGPPDDEQDFFDFVYAFASRYGEGSAIGRVHAIQVWNEPNLSREWGDQAITRESAAAYVRLLAAANRAVKEAGKGIWVVSGGLALTGHADPDCCQPDDEYLRWMFEAGLRGNYDVLGVNANVYCPCVEATPGSVPGFAHPSLYLRRVEQLRDIMVVKDDADKQIWLTEFGWPSAAGFEEARGGLIVQAFKFAEKNWDPWMGVMALWTMANPSWNLEDEYDWDDEQATWAITNADGSNRPTYERLVSAFTTRELPFRRNGPP